MFIENDESFFDDDGGRMGFVQDMFVLFMLIFLTFAGILWFFWL